MDKDTEQKTAGTYYGRREGGRLVEVIPPAFYDEDVLAPRAEPEDGAEAPQEAQDKEREVLHKKGDEVPIAERFHPDFIKDLAEVDPDNLPADDPAPEPSVEELADQARAERERLLNMSDWTQLRDILDKTQSKWKDYRQALRDVPNQPGFPKNITWPEVPK